MTIMGKTTFRIVADESELKDLRDAWNTILMRSISDTVFLTWEWMYSWWECFGEGKELFVVIAEEDDEIIGLAPLHRTRAKIFGLRTLTHLEFLGTTGVITEYPDLIIQKGREHDLIPAFMEFLFRNSSEWDVLNLTSMRQDSENLKLIMAYCEMKGVQYWEYALNASPYIELPADMDEYMKSLSNKSRWKFKDYRKKLEKGRRVELLETKNKQEVSGDFLTIMQLHQKRWEHKGGPGSFAQSRTRFLNFHNRVVQLCFDNKWLSLLRLNVDGVSVAGHYSLMYHDKVYCHTVGFDPDWAEHNVGSVLQLLAIEDSIRKGAKEFDFLRGTEQYKYYWTKKEHICIDTAIWRSRAIARRVIAERKLRKAAKALLPKNLGERIYRKVMNRDE